MKLFIGIVVAAAAPFALSACGGGDDIAPVAAQHPENLAIWTALGGDSAAPAWWPAWSMRLSQAFWRTRSKRPILRL